MAAPSRRLLLTQCCHLPQFFYVAQRLRANHPDAHLEALVADTRQVRAALEHFGGFEKVHFVSGPLPEGPYDAVVLPLLSSGYRRIKRTAARCGGNLLECDGEARLTPLSRTRLLLSDFRTLNETPEDFQDFLEQFPHQRLGSRILFLESASPPVVQGTGDIWKPRLEGSLEVERVKDGGLWKWWDLRKRAFDDAIFFFSGEPGFLGLKILPFLLPIRNRLVINENGAYFYATPIGLLRFWWVRFWKGVTQPPRRTGVLLIQTERDSAVAFAVKVLRSKRLFPDAEVWVVTDPARCEQVLEIEGVTRTLAFRKWGLLPLLREIRRFDPEVVSAIFSGQPGYRRRKALFLALADRKQLVFNPRMSCYWLRPGRLFWLLRRDHLVVPGEEGLVSVPSIDPEVLLLATGSRSEGRKAVKTLLAGKAVRQNWAAVLCRERDATFYGSLPGVSRVYTYRRWNIFFNLRTFWRLLWRDRDVVAALLSGYPIHRLLKSLFFLLPARGRLVFNENLDCFYLTGQNYTSVLRRRRRGRFRKREEVLLIQTADLETTRRAIPVLLSGSVVPQDQVAVLCREDWAQSFLELDAVKKVYRYRKWDLLFNLRTLNSLLRANRDVIAATFTGLPVFRIQKMLFFMLPARHRLVFNEALDCFYLRRGTYSWLLRSGRDVHLDAARVAFRTLAKAILFFPRFVYLLVWLNVMKLKRARYLESR